MTFLSFMMYDNEIELMNELGWCKISHVIIYRVTLQCQRRYRVSFNFVDF